MPSFTYTAIDARSGDERQGHVEADTAQDAAAVLKARGLAPTALDLTEQTGDGSTGPARPGSAAASSARMISKRRSAAGAGADRRRRPIVFGRAVGSGALAVFTRQLATLVRAGLPLVRSLDVLARQEKNPAFRAIVEELAESIRAGGSFSDALRQHPREFDALFVNMVAAGEAGGVLDTTLARLAQFIEKSVRLRARIVAAMTYPAVVTLLAVAIVAALMAFVVPRFEQIFAGMLKGQPLPALTRFVIGASEIVQSHFVLGTMVIAGGGWGFLLLRRTPRGARVLDGWKLRLPVFGDICRKVAVARFTRTLGTLLASGVPILDALRITRGASGNRRLADAIERVHDRVKGGDDLAGPLAATGVFPAMTTSMIEVGEETGALAEMLTRIADDYDEEVDNAVASLTSLLEPLMIVTLAVLVGTIVIALFLPIVSLIQHLQ